MQLSEQQLVQPLPHTRLLPGSQPPPRGGGRVRFRPGIGRQAPRTHARCEPSRLQRFRQPARRGLGRARRVRHPHTRTSAHETRQIRFAQPKSRPAGPAHQTAHHGRVERKRPDGLPALCQRRLAVLAQLVAICGNYDTQEGTVSAASCACAAPEERRESFGNLPIGGLSLPLRSGSRVGWPHAFLPVTVREARVHLVGESGQSGTRPLRPRPTH